MLPPRYTAPTIDAACFGAMGMGVLCDPLLRYPPYAVPWINAACFGAMGVGFLCELFLSYPPYTAPRLNAASFGAMGVGVLDDAFLSYLPPPYTLPGLNAARFGAMGPNVLLPCCPPPPALRLGSVLPILAPYTAVRACVTRIPYGQTGRCSYVAVLADDTLLAAVLLLFC